MDYELGHYTNRKITDVVWADSIELQNEAWSFYLAMVVSREDGYYLSTDSGCSCPVPWENHTFPDDFTGPLSAEQAREELQSLVDRQKKDGYGEGPDEYEVKNLLARIV